jgi:hypothetical protein
MNVFDKPETPAAEDFATVGRRVVAPFARGTTAERHRALEAQGYIVRRGKDGLTVFRPGFATIGGEWDGWRQYSSDLLKV